MEPPVASRQHFLVITPFLALGAVLWVFGPLAAVLALIGAVAGVLLAAIAWGLGLALADLDRKVRNRRAVRR